MKALRCLLLLGPSSSSFPLFISHSVLTLTHTAWGRCQNSTHFTHENTEAPQGEGTGLRSPSSQGPPGPSCWIHPSVLPAPAEFIQSSVQFSLTCLFLDASSPFTHSFCPRLPSSRLSLLSITIYRTPTVCQATLPPGQVAPDRGLPGKEIGDHLIRDQPQRGALGHTSSARLVPGSAQQAPLG